MPDKIAVPQNLDELKVALGRAVVASMHKQMGSTDYVLDGADAHYIAAAESWINHYRPPLQFVALVAKQAMANSNEPRISLEHDINANLHGVGEFLRNCQPRYFADVFKAGTSQTGQALQDFLRLVRRLPAL